MDPLRKKGLVRRWIVQCLSRGMAFGRYQFDGAAGVSCVRSASLYGIFDLD